MLKTTDLKLQLLGITPALKDKTGLLTPQQIVSLSALLTFKGKSVKQLLNEAKEKGQDLDEKILKILKKSSLRGHASIATTPVFSFTYEASKFLDSMLTGIVFSSSLMASGRRTDTTPEDTVFPSTILKNKKLKDLYYQASKKNIDTYRFLIDQGVVKDQASRILHYGIYGTGIISLPVESLISFKREYQLEKEWLPEEAGILLQKIESQLKKMGIDLLYATRSVAPRNIYPYPNIFKNPKNTNLTRELRKKYKLAKLTKVLDFQAQIPQSLKKELNALLKETSPTRAGRRDWYQFELQRRKLVRDYNSCLSFKVLSSVIWRVWGEKKRHRTVPQVVESVYYCLDQAWNVFKKIDPNQGLSSIEKIDSVFSIPALVRTNKEWHKKWLEAALNSFETYYQLVKKGIPPREAIFIIPRALRIDVLQKFDFYNLLVGYYPLRLCTTAEQEMHALTVEESNQLIKLLKKKKLGSLAKQIVPKCHLTGFCPEENFCGQIKLFNKKYNQNLHKKMHRGLEKRFDKNLKSI